MLTTEASERLGLRGCFQLVSYDLAVGIARLGDKECFVVWPVSVIRQYRLESIHGEFYKKNCRTKRITIEVGRLVN